MISRAMKKLSLSVIGYLFFCILTSQYDLDRFKNIYILAAPPGIQDIEFDEYVSEDLYIFDTTGFLI